jgi:hypothetical protein
MELILRAVGAAFDVSYVVPEGVRPRAIVSGRRLRVVRVLVVNVVLVDVDDRKLPERGRTITS